MIGFLKNLYKFYLKYFYYKKNYFKTDFSNNVLISYIAHPFQLGPSLSNGNTVEALCIADIFRELSFNVDVINFDSVKDINFSRYDIVFGAGLPFSKCQLFSTSKCKSIYYAAGTYFPCVAKTLAYRIKEFKKRSGIFIPEAFRLSSNGIVKMCGNESLSLALSDAIIFSGNSFVENSYKDYLDDKPVYKIPLSNYFQINTDAVFENKDFDEAKTNFLWFGGPGAIYKGLDLLIEYFSGRTDLHLHICTNFSKEGEFYNYYKSLIEGSKNIHYYGYISVNSDSFIRLIQKCGFAVLLSCGEGENASIVNLMCCGVVPICNMPAGIDLPNTELLIDSLNVKSIDKVITRASFFSKTDLENLSRKCSKETITSHSIVEFKKSMKNAIIKILEK